MVDAPRAGNCVEWQTCRKLGGMEPELRPRQQMVAKLIKSCLALTASASLRCVADRLPVGAASEK
jgi:hypothetical protein